MANQPPFLRFMMINKNRSKNFTWNFANAFQIMLKTLIINIIITINNLREFLGHWLIELSYILYFTICSRENIEFYIIEDVQSTWDRTYFLMLVFSADPAGRRRDRQTDRHIKGTPLGLLVTNEIILELIYVRDYCVIRFRFKFHGQRNISWLKTLAVHIICTEKR